MGVPGVSAAWRPSDQPETNRAEPARTETRIAATRATPFRRPFARVAATGAGCATGARSTGGAGASVAICETSAGTPRSGRVDGNGSVIAGLGYGRTGVRTA